MPATTTHQAAEAYAASTTGDANRSDPYAANDLRKLEETAADILGIASLIAPRLERLTNARCAFGPVDCENLALMMAEALDPILTSEALGVIFAEIKAGAAPAQRVAA